MTVKKIDKYDVLEQIGSGGMGTVYKAIHPQFKRYVAIKEIQADLANHPDVQRRFAREAELLAQIPAHPNIVTVRDALVWNHRLYLVLDYIEGGTLRERLGNKVLDSERGAHYLYQILSGLEAIHRSGIVHRDIKSANILIDAEERVYITDFGIAEAIGTPVTSLSMATARYAAPELLDEHLGQGADEQQIDIYAAGMVAYEMLLGEKKFRESFLEVYNGSSSNSADQWFRWHTDLTRHARSLNEIDQNIPRPLALVIGRMMAKNVNERYRHANQAKQDLASFLRTSQDMRNHRDEFPMDEVTLPVDRRRKGGASAAYRPESAYAEREQISSGRGNEQPPSARRRIPYWALYAGGFLLFLVISLTLVWALTKNPGFTLIVMGAPQDSNVYVDKILVGVPVVDGKIKVFGLRPGTRAVRVSFNGSEVEKSVVGKDGEEQLLSVDLQAKPRDKMIDYKGQMMLVAAGDFTMGSDNYLDDEKPAHSRSMPYDYYIDRYEVTNKQYLEFCEATNRAKPNVPFWDKDYFTKPDYPVLNVTYRDAEEYARWAGKRLPTEPEWEKAASWNPETQKKTIWPWGDTFEASRCKTLAGHSFPVGQSESGKSHYGVYDMAGNMDEWVSDNYQPYNAKSPSNELFGNTYKVVRGGNFHSSAEDVRTTRRFTQKPDILSEENDKENIQKLIGFRCAISAEEYEAVRARRQ